MSPVESKDQATGGECEKTEDKAREGLKVVTKKPERKSECSATVSVKTPLTLPLEVRFAETEPKATQPAPPPPLAAVADFDALVAEGKRILLEKAVLLNREGQSIAAKDRSSPLANRNAASHSVAQGPVEVSFSFSRHQLAPPGRALDTYLAAIGMQSAKVNSQPQREICYTALDTPNVVHPPPGLGTPGSAKEECSQDCQCPSLHSSGLKGISVASNSPQQGTGSQ